ncbi:uncharacterized protein PHACADRAFT_203111 [Phanerochaete carnosa HHB-10118-sp]|uniref:Uncharacterized protein n=1 Tax=Phanerochaete carnosa (strain HHB-10118-sp) TaxID=650164 RepID=K5VNM7_PHACS|nr:uncharacterized protein PHACADRAFT_203111 [Phanerochaete carnosa HHB-10118-sp]EKM48204.1 hypothetical protein PHACADRAFT_203111 [Phanerochaete carnosa HHB-10118-sp]
MSQQDVYIIKPCTFNAAGNWPWQLIVESAAIAAEILWHPWGTEKISVVCELTNLSLPHMKKSGLYCGLGIQQLGFKTSKEEYTMLHWVQVELFGNWLFKDSIQPLSQGSKAGRATKQWCY